MKSTIYSKFCTKMFKNIFPRYNQEKIDEKNITLAQADIPNDYETYYSIALMNTIISIIITLAFLFLLYSFIPSFYTFLLIVLAPLIIALFLSATYLYLPKYYVKRRERNIDLFLPYAINFISSMAVAGI